jgi:prepilin-type N-terminal cleavage/methylation domain-containing protein
MSKERNHGFTLIELLIVIAIFALMANLTMVSLNNAKRESRDAKRMTNVNQLRSALHLYSTENLSYPTGTGIALGTDNNLILDSTGWVSSNPVSPIFMYTVPRDPSMINQSSSNPCTAASTDTCDYSYTVNGNDYIIYFYLEGTIGDKAQGLHFATKDTLM